MSRSTKLWTSRISSRTLSSLRSGSLFDLSAVVERYWDNAEVVGEASNFSEGFFFVDASGCFSEFFTVELFIHMDSLWSESVFIVAEKDEALDVPNLNGLNDVMWYLVWDHARIFEDAGNFHCCLNFGETSGCLRSSSSLSLSVRSRAFHCRASQQQTWESSISQI